LDSNQGEAGYTLLGQNTPRGLKDKDKKKEKGTLFLVVYW
jgi:hypothetical protein